MVNLEAYKAESWKGQITSVEQQKLRDFLETPEKIQAFKDGMTRYPKSVKTEKQREEYRETRIDTTVLVIGYHVVLNDKEYNNKEFFNIPTITGWGRSKLKAFREKNDLSFNTEEWKGKPITVSINKDGYLRLLE